MFGALLALVLFAADPSAATPTPTPPPEQDTEVFVEPGQDPVVVEEPVIEPLPPRHVHRDIPDLAVVPSAGLAGYAGEDAYGRSITGLHLWAGVLVHPAPNELGPFMGIGGSFDSVWNREGASEKGNTWYGMVEARYGVAWLVEPRRYEGALFPGAAVYAIGGWRQESGRNLYRAGGGIASPMLMAYSVAESCLPLPSMVEVVVDAPDGKFSGPDARTSVRAGWQF